MRAIVPDPDTVAAFAAERADGALTVMAINKTTTGTAATISLSGFTPGTSAQAWQLRSTNAIQRLADVAVTASSLGTTLPAQSITLFVIPRATAPPPPPLPTISIGDVTVAEGNGGTTNARFTATLSAASGSAVTVAYATANGTATAGSDYTARSGTLTFAAGATQQLVDVAVTGDTTVEPNETFLVNLSGPSGATIADAQGQGTITNDDAAPASGLPGDFNGDGQGDLLWHHQRTGDLYAWLMNGTRAASGSYLTPRSFADVNWQIRGLADFNGDGHTDVLWHHQKTGDLYVWMLDGTVTTAGSYLDPRSFSDTNWQIRATVDFNKDGKPDILWHHQKTGDLYVWFLNGVHTVSGAYLTPSRFADTKWQLRATLDPNKDGEPDLLWHHQRTGDLYLWFMKGTTAVSGIYLTPSQFTDTRWQIVRACDFNRDGTTDLLWHHQATGQLYAWFMTGTTVTGGSYLDPPAFTDTSWKVMPRVVLPGAERLVSRAPCSGPGGDPRRSTSRVLRDSSAIGDQAPLPASDPYDARALGDPMSPRRAGSAGLATPSDLARRPDRAAVRRVRLHQRHVLVRRRVRHHLRPTSGTPSIRSRPHAPTTATIGNEGHASRSSRSIV